MTKNLDRKFPNFGSETNYKKNNKKFCFIMIYAAKMCHFAAVLGK